MITAGILSKCALALTVELGNLTSKATFLKWRIDDYSIAAVTLRLGPETLHLICQVRRSISDRERGQLPSK